MNILPKKRWHVRTKDNIARVRRDEAKADEEVKAKKARMQKAETEARIQLLRQQARKKYDGRSESTEMSTSIENMEHVNFFNELEAGKIDYRKSNKYYEKEKKEDQEKYDKKIGYLTYLGQNSIEKTGKINWYNKVPERPSISEKGVEADKKRKALEDPIHNIKRHLSGTISTAEDRKSSDESAMVKERKCKSTDLDREKNNNINKNKINKSNTNKLKSTKCTQNNIIEKLRAERTLRERIEKLKTVKLIVKLQGISTPFIPKEKSKSEFRQKYNSQFFPELARQNVEKIIK
ncbi:leukocyte receptor cluster member 1 homolog [Belonocnema kinseyi]|uniref:leukocyte receptor cluster member 1 homolog n=1 Tax=Belonocnema kinseyi TaxID=2817044 RepID=UPI00143D6347|nr:leukocyte receptor cluster member 1 homolog [Belonocnema kinseyi]